jgi:hypothetical protein
VAMAAEAAEVAAEAAEVAVVTVAVAAGVVAAAAVVAAAVAAGVCRGVVAGPGAKLAPVYGCLKSACYLGRTSLAGPVKVFWAADTADRREMLPGRIGNDAACDA